MAQFVVYQNPNPSSQQQYPYLLDVQSNLLSELRTTIVIPLSPLALVVSRRITKLNPVLEVNGEDFVVLTQEVAGVDRRDLGAKVSDASASRDEIVAAFDFALSGI